MRFVFVFAIVLFIGCTYVSLRLISQTSLSGWRNKLAYLFCFSPMLHIPTRYTISYMASAGQSVPHWLDVILYGAYILIGALSVIALMTFCLDMFLLSKKLWQRFSKKKPIMTLSSSQKALSSPDRRHFLQNSLSAGIMVVGGSMVAYGASEAVSMPEMKHISVPVKNLPSAFHGYTLVQLTDLHINNPASPARLQHIVDKINSLDADAIVITGDLSDSYPNQVQEALQPLLNLRAKDGIYFVSGNHEYYTDIDAWLVEVQRLGMTSLQNEHRVIERQGQRLLICGVPDTQAPSLSNHTSSPEVAQQGSKVGDIKILLAHRPQSIFEAVKFGYAVQISGHTHGGQFFPWTYVIDIAQPYIHGLYDVQGTQLYVSRGIGYWGPPMRIGAPSEMTLLKLMPA